MESFGCDGRRDLGRRSRRAPAGIRDNDMSRFAGALENPRLIPGLEASEVDDLRFDSLRGQYFSSLERLGGHPGNSDNRHITSDAAYGRFSDGNPIGLFRNISG